MRQELIERLSEMGCSVHETSHNIFNCNGQQEVVSDLLMQEGYEIMGRNDHNVWFRPTIKLFVPIVCKYDIEDVFQAMEAFNELKSINECSFGASGSEFHIWNFETGFGLKIDFKTHKAVVYVDD